MTGSHAALAAAWGAFASIERKAFGQLMLSRPIVVAPILGAILGHAHAGLAIGIPLELFFLGSSSYGASTPEHETMSALFSAAAAATALDQLPFAAISAVLALAAYLGLPFARIGRIVEAALERFNEGLVDRAEVFLDEGHLGRASRQALLALLLTALLGAAVASLGVLAGPAIASFVDSASVGTMRGLDLAWALFVGVSAALGLRAIQVPGGKLLSGIAALTVFAVFALSSLLLR